MGVTITATNSTYEFHMGYGGFFNLRKNIAIALDKEFGEVYANLSSCITDSQFIANDKNAEFVINKNCLKDNYADVLEFLYMPDSNGSVPYTTCRSIYKLIKDIDFKDKTFRYGAYANNDYEEFKRFLLECVSKRRKMRWY